MHLKYDEKVILLPGGYLRKWQQKLDKRPKSGQTRRKRIKNKVKDYKRGITILSLPCLSISHLYEISKTWFKPCGLGVHSEADMPLLHAGSENAPSAGRDGRAPT